MEKPPPDRFGCAAPLPKDGLKNGQETDIDCGGPDAPACRENQRCHLHTDCEGNLCLRAQSPIADIPCYVQGVHPPWYRSQGLRTGCRLTVDGYNFGIPGSDFILNMSLDAPLKENCAQECLNNADCTGFEIVASANRCEIWVNAV